MSTDVNAMDQEEICDPDGDDRDDDNDVEDEVEPDDAADGGDGNGDDGEGDGDDDHDGAAGSAGDEEEKEDDGVNDDGDDNDDSLTEGEEDLEATVKSINERARRAHEVSSAVVSELHVTADDFIRNFLCQMRMTATLDTFQTEWTEMAWKGLLNTKRVGEVPDVYVQNQRLHSELKNALRERDEYRLAASASAQTLWRAQKARDVQWMKSKRVAQEKNRLAEESRRLKNQCHAYEPAIRKMDDKFQVVVEQTMRVALERDKVVNLVQSQPRPHTAQAEKAQKTHSSANSSHRLSYRKML
ncbi:sperm-associated antigen 16 protein-like [Syngnathoides biaculeatus]|uniref:sperm-associated antigen 16 protein-like n=1 Tax=Syngnathoides biaculeatus TaxID=300417 RepID=UPI002ADDC23A|nr:sperm-associated antigen 16 protein-like [Syngnathoides biaculeatus]